jgi:hypothetical protein
MRCWQGRKDAAIGATLLSLLNGVSGLALRFPGRGGRGDDSLSTARAMTLDLVAELANIVLALTISMSIVCGVKVMSCC